MNRSGKQEVVAKLNKTFNESSSIVLVEFKGINVPDITELRRQIRESGSDYRVVKNTLAIRAAKDTPVAALEEHFKGATAVAFTENDSVALAKILREFIKAHPSVSFKAGILEGQAISSEQVEALADMPSRDELLSKLAFLLNAPLTQFATALQSPLRKLMLALKQIAEAKQQ